MSMSAATPIAIGSPLPETPLHTLQAGKPYLTSLAEWAAAKRVVLFTLPGAFTPTCTAKHLPSFMQQARALHGKGIAAIGCMAVNDIFVMRAWGEANGAMDTIDMLADTAGETSAALGIAMDSHPVLGGGRAHRTALVADGGVITHFAMDKHGEFNLSSAEYLLTQL